MISRLLDQQNGFNYNRIEMTDERKQAKEILSKYYGNVYEEPEEFTEIIAAMESHASLKVAEATKEMYPIKFIVWLVNIDNNPFGKVITGMHDALYVNFYEGSERKYTLDELFEYWKQNIGK